MSGLILRSITAIAVALLFCGNLLADVHVRGYYRSNGTYVAPHYRSSPDSSRSNNWSTKGNVNPYTGKPGTKNDYSGLNSEIGSNDATTNSNSASSAYAAYAPPHPSYPDTSYRSPAQSPPADIAVLTPSTNSSEAPGNAPNWPALGLIGGVIALIIRMVFVKG